MTTPDLLSVALDYLRALEQGAVGERLAGFFTPDVVIEELPSRLKPNGERQSLEQALVGAERGRELLAWQRYEVLSSTVQGERVALEVAWSAELRVQVPGLPQGPMKARSAMFLSFRDGKIAGQRNYDCFEPW